MKIDKKENTVQFIFEDVSENNFLKKILENGIEIIMKQVEVFDQKNEISVDISPILKKMKDILNSSKSGTFYNNETDTQFETNLEHTVIILDNFQWLLKDQLENPDIKEEVKRTHPEAIRILENILAPLLPEK